MNQPARQHQLLELHSIEYIAYQWDGSKNQAQVVTRERGIAVGEEADEVSGRGATARRPVRKTKPESRTR